jgi:hypothetical protein
MIVFWSSDPDATYGFDGTERREWAKQLGIKMVHIDPYLNHTAAHLGGKWISPKPGTDPAIAQALCHVWITEACTTRSSSKSAAPASMKWKAYILGESDGIAKTPEWQETETGVPARDVRALAREWGTKKTYLGAGGWGVGLGGAGRGPMGIQWARMMTILGAMQGYGRRARTSATCSSARRSTSTSISPATAKARFSGEMMASANTANNYQRMPHILTMSSVRQAIPRMWFPEAITQGKAMGYLTDVASIQGQFFPFGYPVARPRARRDALQVRQLLARHAGGVEPLDQGVPAREPEVRRQPVDLVGGRDAVRRRGAARLHGVRALGHRRVVQRRRRLRAPHVLDEQPSRHHPCSTRRSSRSASRSPTTTSSCRSWRSWAWARSTRRAARPSSTGASACSIRRTWRKHISWRQFLKKGYYVVPAEAEAARAPTAGRWFYEGRKKDTPEPYPLPVRVRCNGFGSGLQTPSGKFEFVASTLKRIDDPDRPPLNQYMPLYEDGKRDPELAGLPAAAADAAFALPVPSDG